MACNAGPKIVNDGLVLALDAGNTKSYSTFITYVGGTSDSDNSSSFTLSGLQSGDLVLYFSAEDAALVNTPTGENWTAIPGLGAQPDNDTNPNSAAFYVFATGTSVTASGLSTFDNHVRVMIAFRNVDSTNPFDVNATQNSGGVLPNPPSITPVTNNSMIVAVGLQDDEDIANSISPPTGYTTAVIMDSLGGANNAGVGGATIMTAYKLLATAAAEDPGAFTSSNGSASDPNKGISIALRSENSKEVVNPLTWTDLVGSGIGTLTNGPTFDSGNGGSIVFDGTDDYVDLPTTSSLDITGTISVNSWFSLSTTPSGTNTIYEKGYDGTFEQTYFKFESGELAFGTYNNPTDYKTGWIYGSSIQTNTFYNVVGQFTGTQYQIYVNGALVSSTNETQPPFQSTAPISIGGAYITNQYSRFFNGKIPYVSVYNRALTASEIQQNFNALKGRFGI